MIVSIKTIGIKTKNMCFKNTVVNIVVYENAFVVEK